MARPLKEINWEEFEKLCGIQCTLGEIAAWFQVSPDTIERAVKRQYKQGFAETFRQKQDLGKISLRRKLFQKAMEGQPALLIWLSKNMLGYSDKLESTVTEGKFIFEETTDE